MSHPLMAMKKSSTSSLRRHNKSNCLATFSSDSSSLLISSIRTLPNCSKSWLSLRTSSILFLSIFLVTKIILLANTTNIINIFQAIPGIVNEQIFEEQTVTEDNKKPDFLFSNAECYHNFEFPAEELTMLGAKTTCKDRWRQVINEADLIEIKHLFTLQPGISKNQLKEMSDNGVKLVVPQKNISTFPIEYQSSLSNLTEFIHMVRNKQDSLPKYYNLI